MCSTENCVVRCSCSPVVLARTFHARPVTRGCQIMTNLGQTTNLYVPRRRDRGLATEAISELLPPSTKSRETDAAWDWGTDLTDGLRLTHWTAYGLLLLLAVGLIFSAAACAGFSLNVLEPPRCFSFPWKCGKVNIGLREEFASFCKNPRWERTLPVLTR